MEASAALKNWKLTRDVAAEKPRNSAILAAGISAATTTNYSTGIMTLPEVMIPAQA